MVIPHFTPQNYKNTSDYPPQTFNTRHFTPLKIKKSSNVPAPPPANAPTHHPSETNSPPGIQILSSEYGNMLSQQGQLCRP